MARKGLPKSIIKKYGITKKAWRVFRGRSKSRSRRTKTTRRKNNPKRRRTNLARRKRRRGGKSLTTTVFKFVRLGALVAPAAHQAMLYPGDAKGTINGIINVYTGYDLDQGTFDPGQLAQGWGPYLMAVLATYGIPKIAGIIRKI